ncbi:MAG: sigma-54-dependent Fis family transcriptional regulator [Candidatus Zixiibacteriota bacterium]|nr:MAG: sigma-54-dependent Fis family transcriptional regulator [candidate division Zixibacteria bacterium]
MRLLVVDDEERQRELLTEYLNDKGHKTRAAENGEVALNMIKNEGAEAAFVDMRMPGMDGLAFIKRSLELYPDLAIVVMTAYGTVESAVEAMKAGAFDYLLKPVDLDHIELILSKIVETHRLIAENRYLKRKLEEVEIPEGIIGESKAIKNVLADVHRIAQSDATILIRGESGTGKELVANAIHNASPRAKGPFLAVNCASLPETLLESELFGYEKGAFTGAVSRRLGRFELAGKGTIFLDEIGDITPAIQVKLLRVLESKKIQRLGSGKDIPVDIRILTATNRDLESKMQNSEFREDLFYRLNVIPLTIPPLRERRDDILPLTEHFIKKYSVKNNKNIKGITAEAKDLLLNHSWPGNVRELENLIERAIVLVPGDVIDLKDLDPFIAQRPASPAPGFDNLNLEHIEKQAIIEALKRTAGSLTKASEILGIHRNSIRLKINKYGIKH